MKSKIIPKFPPKDEKFPASPVVNLNIPNFGDIYIKDESVHRWSGTHKDRMAWEIIIAYKNLEQAIKDGRIICEKKDDKINRYTLPQFSLISSGSAAIAIGRMLKEYGYPPLKVLADISLEDHNELCSNILSSNCELFLHDISKKEVTSSEILQMTNNPSGFDLTDFQNAARSIFSYDWLCYEILNEEADYIFTPYGSGTLFREIINIIKNEVTLDTLRDTQDIRLKNSIKIKKMRFINVLGATSNNPQTKAVKLYAPFRPNHQRNLHKIYYYKQFGYIGDKTGVYTILEKYLEKAYDLMKTADVTCEYSGCAGLALFLQMKNEIPRDSKVLIINTGKLRLQ